MNVEAIKIWLKKSKSNLMISQEAKEDPDILLRIYAMKRNNHLNQ
jgi:hypothetical protein